MGFETKHQFGKGYEQSGPGKQGKGFGKKEARIIPSEELPSSPFNPKNKRPSAVGELTDVPGILLVKGQPVRQGCGHLAPAYKETGDCRFKCGAK